MEKWECLACGYIYDPLEGDPGGNIPPGRPLRICPTIGFALSVGQERTCLKRSSEMQEVVG